MSEECIGRALEKKIAEQEMKLKDFHERFDERCIDIETIIGLNHKSEVDKIKPFRERIEKLEGFKEETMELINQDGKKIDIINDDNIRIFKDIRLSLEANFKRIEKLEKYHVNVEWINKELKELKASIQGIKIREAFPELFNEDGTKREFHFRENPSEQEIKDCVDCDTERLYDKTGTLICIENCKEKEPTGPDQGISMGDNIPEGFDIIKEMEEEPTELYPSPYSKEQENFGKYVRVEKADLKRMRELLTLLNSYIDHHTNDFEGHRFFIELGQLMEKYLEEEK